AYLIYALVEPTYVAFSVLQVDPTQPDIFRGGPLHGTNDLHSAMPYLQTQVNLISSDRVLDPAVANRTVVNLPMIKRSPDPKSELREKMTVEIVGKDTYLIR